ncbi:MAG TPA: D-2-hydroxyacid dehydrogenase [Terriglobales bacterium]|nr:D-2-hydroxyacid dehydrogenase [Terriglobales bacterium]
MKVVIVTQYRFSLWNAPESFIHRLRNDFPAVEFVYRPNFEDIEKYISDADVLAGASFRPEQIRAAKKLKWIYSTAAAVHQLLFPELINSDIVVTSASEVHGHCVAQHVLALIFAAARRLDVDVRYQQRRFWGQEELWAERPRPREVDGATLGLIGVGAIGRDVARMSSAIGMRVIAVREHPERGVDWLLPGSPEISHNQVYGTSQLPQMLNEADFVVLAAPTTPRTQKLINAERLAQMKPDAWLINVGRGALVDELALINALRNRAIGGAALDVFDTEPLPPDSPLWGLDNVIITPHVAGMTDKIWDRQFEFFSENLRRFMVGKPLLGVVDKRKGY